MAVNTHIIFGLGENNMWGWSVFGSSGQEIFIYDAIPQTVPGRMPWVGQWWDRIQNYAYMVFLFGNDAGS